MLEVKLVHYNKESNLMMFYQGKTGLTEDSIRSLFEDDIMYVTD